MKKIAIGFMFLALVACAGGNRTLPPEGERIASVTDTSKCTFIKKDYQVSRPEMMVSRIKLNVYNAGGDSYKIISSNPNIIGTVNTTQVDFEIWKCK